MSRSIDNGEIQAQEMLWRIAIGRGHVIKLDRWIRHEQDPVAVFRVEVEAPDRDYSAERIATKDVNSLAALAENMMELWAKRAQELMAIASGSNPNAHFSDTITGEICVPCGGTGTVHAGPLDPDGRVVNDRECVRCKGRGRFVMLGTHGRGAQVIP